MDTDIFKIPKDFIFRQYDCDSDLQKYRTVFMRDRDRAMYCTAFRRLAGKTQIYTIGSDDHKKNRLTHSLEVAQIARTIACALNLDENLAEAIALGHDFGHTPFGHAGEQMLHRIMIPCSKYVKNSPFYGNSIEDMKKTLERESKDSLPDEAACIQFLNSTFGFKHNIQSIRVAAYLEDSYRGEENKNIGLNLTNYTLWGMLHHSKIKYEANDIYPNYHNKFERHLLIRNGVSEAWSFEAYVVEQADDIAQWHHDLEDAIRGNAMPLFEICETISRGLGDSIAETDRKLLNEIKNKPMADRKSIADISHIVVNTLVNDIVSTSEENFKILNGFITKRFQNISTDDISKSMYGDYDNLGLPIQRENVISFSGNIKKDVFKDTIRKWVHHSRNVERMNEKGKYIIRKMFEAYCTHPQQLPDGPITHFMVEIGKYKNIDEAQLPGIGEVRTEFEKIMENPTLHYRILLMRRICDCIASMTDHYAIKEYNSLYG